MWKLTRRKWKQGGKECSSKEKIHLKLSAKEMFKYLGLLFSKTNALQFQNWATADVVGTPSQAQHGDSLAIRGKELII